MRQKNFRSLRFVDIDKITANEYQPRKTFDDHTLAVLSESIRNNGIIQPLCVRKVNDGYILVSGERRLRAAEMAGLKKIPCVITETDWKGAALLALIENIQREKLDCFEEADGIFKMVSLWGMTREDVAAKLGISNTALSRKLRLLNISLWERERIKNAHLSEDYARELLRIEDTELRDEVLLTVIAKGFSLSETEEYIDKLFEPPSEEPKPVRQMVVGDLRLAENTLGRAVETVRKSGMNIIAEKSENDEFIQFRILLPKRNANQNEPCRETTTL